ncbi:MAG: bifunctional pyr operon transcriptional regulator/uracil phosphoribosyltransferase PyrR [Gemmatimonadota bacterium]|nr:bifunctional pyr operon transcriptional regulator/uracil phosphoribosyltransferase PyrR [Gemmatimonadota bacterium]
MDNRVHDAGRVVPCKAPAACLPFFRLRRVGGAPRADSVGDRLSGHGTSRKEYSTGAFSLHVAIMDEKAVRRTVARMARELVEHNKGPHGLSLMGIHRRGVQIARLIRAEIERAESVIVPLGTLDITLYRDDLMAIGPRPVVGASDLPKGGVDDRAVVIVDDVLFTGRTIRAALNELTDWGRPSRVSLCVLVDRGGREIPIQPNVVGKTLSVPPDHTVEVSVPDLDGEWSVDIVTLTPEGP